jgi:tripartite motif-containing protein 71
MSASPTVAPPVDAGPAEDVTEESPRKRRKLLLLLLLLLGFALLLGLAIWYLLFRQPIPLPVIPGETVMPTYTTSIYGANRPMGVAVSLDGSRVYAGETGGDKTARVFDGGGTALGLMQPPISTGREHAPVYLATDPLTGEVYVSDRPTGSIYIYDVIGTYQRTFDPGEGLAGWQPLGMTFDSAGNFYVTDVGADPQQIIEFDRMGQVVRTLGKTAGLNFPNGVAVDGTGNVYVTDGNNGRLVVLGASDTIIAQVGRGVGDGNLGLPRGIAIDGQGRVYVGDATGQGVFIYSTLQAGQNTLDFLGFLGGQGVENGTFLYPNGVTVDARGRIYVADSGNDRIQVWSY